MKASEIYKEIKGVFKPPIKQYYFGKNRYGSPYFDPMHYVGSIIRVRKLIKRPVYEVEEKNEQYKHKKNHPENLYLNMPMVRRAKNKIVHFFGNDYYITWGWPVSVKTTDLGWKDKYDSPRFEWSPQFAIYFFGLQFIIWWTAPKLDGQKYSNNDKYYEMILWYLRYSDKDIKKAEETWGWVDSKTKESTWDKRFLI